MATIDNRPRIWAERFEIVRKLGTGGMGEVWLARDLEMNGAYVALKFVRRELGSDTRAVNDLRREVTNARSLTHDRVVRVHELMKYGDTYFITMEYVEGEDLNTRLGLYQQEGRNFALEEVLAVARDVCAAVEYAHSLKVLHLDLKPSNVVAMAAGGYKVMDFGIARAAQESMTRVSRAAGYTGGYAAPEQILGKPVDRRTDVYGLAATFYDLLAGRVPCPTDYATVNVPPEPLPGVPAYVNAALLRALAKDPAERFPTAAALSGVLRGEKPPATAETGKDGILGKAIAPEVKATASPGTTTPPIPLAPPTPHAAPATKITPPTKPPRPVRKGLYLFVNIASILWALGVTALAAGFKAEGEALAAALVVAFVPLCFWFVMRFVLLYKAWAAIQDGRAQTTPGTAVGFLFIPLFNLYWVFRAYGGFARDCNEYLTVHGVKAKQLPRGVFVTFAILCVLSIIPVISYGAGILLMIFEILVTNYLCNAINQLAAYWEINQR